MSKMRYTGEYIDSDGSTWISQRDATNREWLTNKKTGETKMSPDSAEIQRKARKDPRDSVRGQKGYSKGGSVRGVGCATKGTKFKGSY